MICIAEDDPTLRKGDIVSVDGGLMVASPGKKRSGAALNFTPAPKSLRAQFERPPVVVSR
ncbi:hypothetical protein E0H22_21200 [Rhodopseudomonas boonkerdii]|nr:hypothetical protein E0H22_21200 [Rhodopseudomonas boonkerdii]